MKLFTKTLLSGGTSFCIISGTFSTLGFIFMAYGLLLTCQSLLIASRQKQAYSFVVVKND